MDNQGTGGAESAKNTASRIGEQNIRRYCRLNFPTHDGNDDIDNILLTLFIPYGLMNHRQDLLYFAFVRSDMKNHICC